MGSLKSPSVWCLATFVSHHLFLSSLHLSEKLTLCSVSSFSRFGILARHVIPGEIPVVDKLFQLHAVSIKPIFMFPYCNSEFLFRYLALCIFEGIPPSTVPTGIYASLSFSKTSRSSLTQLILIVLVANFPNLYITLSLVVDLIIAVDSYDCSCIQKIWQIILSCDNVVVKVSVFGSSNWQTLEHPNKTFPASTVKYVLQERKILIRVGHCPG